MAQIMSVSVSVLIARINIGQLHALYGMTCFSAFIQSLFLR